MQHKLIISVLLLIQAVACDKPNVDQFTGSWKLTEMSIDNTALTLCNELSSKNEVKLNIETQGEDLRFSGNSFVNNYFGTFVVSDFTKNTGKLSTSGTGSTKKMGPPNLQNCEYQYLNALNAADSFKLKANGQLEITGNTQADGKDISISLIFEKP